MMEDLKDQDNNLPKKLVVSGVGGPQKQEIIDIIKEKKLENNIILTNFVSNEERNALIQNANIFLFPSLFEGFGMPPIEAMMLGTRVITTKCTSLKEVTDGKCEYVNHPTNSKEWIKKIEKIQSEKPKVIHFPQYEKTKIAREYLNLFYEVSKDKN